MNRRSGKLADLLKLSRELGNPRAPLAILGEGNTSARLGDDRFLVKASGSILATLTAKDVVECRTTALLDMLDMELSDAEVEKGLLASRVHARDPKPSVESLFHAWLLTLSGVEFVGHAHPPMVNGVLCSPRAREFATKRLFPDEIVCCDVEAALVPFVDPGLALARAVRARVKQFIRKRARPPRVVLLENHGVITLGRTAESVLAAMLMTEKAAGIWLGAAASGGPVFMSPKQVTRISARSDEAFRRAKLEK